MDWIDINDSYLDFLRDYEKRIPKTDYGEGRYKPFFGVLFEKNGLLYVTQISHAQKRHLRMKNQPDFYKIYDPKQPDRLIAVVNLNYMFPTPRNEVSPLIKSNIDKYRNFVSEDAKSKYIDLLDSEMKTINTLDLPKAAKYLYNNKYIFPDSKLSLRCLDYKSLEKQANIWIIRKEAE